MLLYCILGYVGIRTLEWFIARWKKQDIYGISFDNFIPKFLWKDQGISYGLQLFGCRNVADKIVNSIRDTCKEEDEIIVVDNGSGSGCLMSIVEEKLYPEFPNSKVVCIDNDIYNYIQVNQEFAFRNYRHYKNPTYPTMEEFIKNTDLQKAKVVYCSIWTDPRETKINEHCYDIDGFLKLSDYCHLLVNLDLVDDSDVGSLDMKNIIESTPHLHQSTKTYYPHNMLFETLDTARFTIINPKKIDI